MIIGSLDPRGNIARLTIEGQRLRFWDFCVLTCPGW